MSESFSNMADDRRSFLRRVAGAAAFATPTVRTFFVASAAIALAPKAAFGQFNSYSSGKGSSYGPHGPHRVPELDATTAGAAVTVLAAGAMIVRDQIASRPKPAAEVDTE